MSVVKRVEVIEPAEVIEPVEVAEPAPPSHPRLSTYIDYETYFDESDIIPRIKKQPHAQPRTQPPNFDAFANSMLLSTQISRKYSSTNKQEGTKRSQSNSRVGLFNPFARSDSQPPSRVSSKGSATHQPKRPDSPVKVTVIPPLPSRQDPSPKFAKTPSGPIRFNDETIAKTPSGPIRFNDETIVLRQLSLKRNNGGLSFCRRVGEGRSRGRGPGGSDVGSMQRSSSGPVTIRFDTSSNIPLRFDSGPPVPEAQPEEEVPAL